MIQNAAYLRARRPKYLSLALIAVQQRFAYRGTIALDLAVYLAQLVAILYLWRSVFASTPQVGSFDYDRMKTYMLLAYVVGSPPFSSVVTGMINLVRTGAIASALTRPVDFMYAQFAEAAGDAAVRWLISGCIAVLLSLLLFHAQLPDSPLAAVFFIVSLLLSFLVRTTFDFLLSLLSCYTLNGRGLGWVQWGLQKVFSGSVIPLEFFPGWLKTTALLLPFQAMVSTPLNIYLGNLEDAEMLAALALQALWALFLWVLSRLLLGPCLRAIEIQGG